MLHTFLDGGVLSTEHIIYVIHSSAALRHFTQIR